MNEWLNADLGATGGTVDILGARFTLGYGGAAGVYVKSGDPRQGVEVRSGDWDGGEYRYSYQYGLASVRATADQHGNLTVDTGVRANISGADGIEIGPDGKYGSLKGSAFAGGYFNGEGFGITVSLSGGYQVDIPFMENAEFRLGGYFSIRALLLEWDDMFSSGLSAAEQAEVAKLREGFGASYDRIMGSPPQWYAAERKMLEALVAGDTVAAARAAMQIDRTPGVLNLTDVYQDRILRSAAGYEQTQDKSPATAIHAASDAIEDFLNEGGTVGRGAAVVLNAASTLAVSVVNAVGSLLDRNTGSDNSNSASSPSGAGTRVVDTPAGPKVVTGVSIYGGSDYGGSDDNDSDYGGSDDRDRQGSNYGGSTYGGSTYGGSTYGGSTYGGSTYGGTGGGDFENTGNNPGNPNAGGYHGDFGDEDDDDAESGGYDPKASQQPVLLDLDGNGISITELSKSSVYLDGGDGKEHRTAWAGSGDGVLFYDAGGDGKITEKREFVFTEWSQGSTSDFEALREAFDTNGDGKLTSADAQWLSFKVMVTNADGTIVAKTLAELGITAIDLRADATRIELPDGSVITGQSSFIRNGIARTAADTTLAMSAEGHRVVRVVTGPEAGFDRKIVNTGYDEDGKIAFVHKVLSKADGSHVRHSFDDNGDGVTDRRQDIRVVVNADGSRTERVVNRVSDDAAEIEVYPEGIQNACIPYCKCIASVPARDQGGTKVRRMPRATGLRVTTSVARIGARDVARRSGEGSTRRHGNFVRRGRAA
jgi:hypothetical protein